MLVDIFHVLSLKANKILKGLLSCTEMGRATLVYLHVNSRNAYLKSILQKDIAELSIQTFRTIERCYMCNIGRPICSIGWLKSKQILVH